MGDNISQPPDEPVLGPTLASSSIEDIPTLDLLVKLELDRGSDGTKPCDDKETEVQTLPNYTTLRINTLC
jgi:hypothetical protein